MARASRKLPDGRGEVGECVLVFALRGHDGEAEARNVRGDDAVFLRQEGDEVAEHVGRRREAVEEEDHRGIGGTRVPVEDFEAVGVDGVYLCDGRHSYYVGWLGMDGSWCVWLLRRLDDEAMRED